VQKQIKLQYNECANLIKEADVLLFRAPKTLFSFGWWIAKLGFTAYSHVGLAHQADTLNCIEFREFIGSRNEPLINQFEQRPKLEIDVFRVDTLVHKPILVDHKSFFTPHNDNCVHQQELRFTPEIAKKITDRAKKLIGKSYSWKIIYKIGISFIPGLRFFIEKNSKENGYELFVCSTLVSYTYRKEFVDLCPLISDLYTQPSDIARSAHLNYLFTVIK
jgi:hypothetical protein